MTATRPFYWSVRRELWENRSIYIAPLAGAAVALFGFLIATIGRAVSMSDPAKRLAVLGEPYDFAMGLIMGTAFIVVASSTVSTRCTANAAIAASCSGSRCRFPISPPCSRRRPSALVILPLLSFAITFATQLIMLLLSTRSRC